VHIPKVMNDTTILRVNGTEVLRRYNPAAQNHSRERKRTGVA